MDEYFITGRSDLLPKAKNIPTGKQKIKQKKDNYSHVWGSKIKAVKKVVVSNEYKQLYKKYGVNNKNNCVYTLSKLIAEKHSKERLIQAFKNNGEKEMI